MFRGLEASALMYSGIIALFLLDGKVQTYVRTYGQTALDRSFRCSDFHSVHKVFIEVTSDHQQCEMSLTRKVLSEK